MLRAERIVAAGRRGSSRPVVVETERGTRLLKLRGAGQGTGPLVAEIVVAELAAALELAVPPRSLVVLEPGIPTADWDDELDDLLAASAGVNLGFDYLDGAHELEPARARALPAELRAAILWLDRLVLNPDRTVRNPHVLWWSDTPWLIDHGAALGFQYQWDRVTESAPRAAWSPPEAHLFDGVVSSTDLAAADARLAPRLDRATLQAALDAVPDAFLSQAEWPAAAGAPALAGPARRRAAYVAYLWKRLQPPRPFLAPYTPAHRPSRSGPPDWVQRR